MPGEFWSFVSMLVTQYGLLALIEVVQAGFIIWLFRNQQKLEKERGELQGKLLDLFERRLEDAKAEREDYEELSRNIEKSISLLIKVFRRTGNLSEDEG